MKKNNGELLFSLKGDRDYVHGTDIYNTFFSDIQTNYPNTNFLEISITYSKMVNGVNLLYKVCKGNICNKNANVSINFTFKGEKYSASLIESKTKVSGRYSFNESSIYKHCVVSAKKQEILLNSKVQFSDIEIFTVMKKRMLNVLFPNVKNWLLTKVEIEAFKLNSIYNEIKLVLVKNRNFKLIKTAIIIDGSHIGFIYFSKAP